MPPLLHQAVDYRYPYRWNVNNINPGVCAKSCLLTGYCEAIGVACSTLSDCFSQSELPKDFHVFFCLLFSLKSYLYIGKDFFVNQHIDSIAVLVVNVVDKVFVKLVNMADQNSLPGSLKKLEIEAQR